MINVRVTALHCSLGHPPKLIFKSHLLFVTDKTQSIENFV